MKYPIFHITFFLFSILTTGMLLTSCADPIDKDARWTEEKIQELPGSEAQTLLIEEYTGQKCINCPQAAKILSSLSESYKGRIITVSMHAHRSGQTLPTLESVEADRYAAHFKIPQVLPGIMLNRTVIDSQGLNYSSDRAQWAALVKKAINRPARYRIDLSATLIDDRDVSITVQSTKREGIKDETPLGLNVWIVEDIIERQLVGNEMRQDYLHHNVLRDRVNEETSHTTGKTYDFVHRVSDKVVDPQNAKVVAFIYDTRTNEVLEASIVALGKGFKDHDNNENEENPNSETSDEKIISFKYSDQTLKSGDEITVNTSEKMEDGTIEMVTPVFTVSGPSKVPYTVVAEKVSHKDNDNVGLTSFCLSICMAGEKKFNETFQIDSYKINPKDMATIHYGIAKSEASKSDKYKVRLVFLQDKKEVAHLNVVFDYTAENKPNDNAGNDTPNVPDPQPQPDPTPAPTPTPGTDADLSEAPEKLKSTVLAVDCTGQRCGYCKYAIAGLNDAHESFGSDLIIVAMHSYSYAADKRFYTNNSFVYYEELGVRWLPSVFLNLNKYRMSYNKDVIGQAIEPKPEMKSVVKAEINGNNINIRFRSDPNNGMKQSHTKYNVLLWIVENNVVGYQAGLGSNYNHQHVFRGYLNGKWGESYTPGKTYTKIAETPYDYMKIENCEVIAIVIDSDTHEYIDAVKVELKK